MPRDQQLSPASQAVCRGFDSLRPLQFLEQKKACHPEKIEFFGFVLPNCTFVLGL